MKQVKNKTIDTINKSNVQLEPFCFEWERFMPTLQKEFPDISSEMLSHKSQQQQQPLNLNENRYIPCRDREQYSYFRKGTNRIKETLTTPSPTMTHLNMERFHHLSHSTPEALNTHNGNGHFANQTYQATQIRGHTHNNASFRMMNTPEEQQGFYHRGSSR